MPLIRSLRSSTSQSKRLRRRLRNLIDKFTGLFALRSGISSTVFTLFLFLLFLFLVNNLFTITKVQCSLDHEECSSEILQKLNRNVGSNVLLLNQKQLSESLTQSFSVEKVTIGFKIFSTLKVTLDGGNPPLLTLVYLVKDLPLVSLDSAPGSTESADWPKPSQELAGFLKTASASGFGLWDNGRMTPIATTESSIKYIITEKPDDESVRSLYRLIKLVNKYLNLQDTLVVGQKVFLSQSGQPDIIVSVPFDEGRVSEAIKSYSYLVALKKDAKVIDLRFKNPIIR